MLNPTHQALVDFNDKKIDYYECNTRILDRAMELEKLVLAQQKIIDEFKGIALPDYGGKT